MGAPHELFARPPLSPLFHLYTLASLIYAASLDAPPKLRYWTLVVRDPPAALLVEASAMAWILPKNAKAREARKAAISRVCLNVRSDPNGIRNLAGSFGFLRDFDASSRQ